jgi:FlaA1/EpsC-like NDP-sugar epimerase
MFEVDIQANATTLSWEVEEKSVCVIGGAGSIGLSFIKAVLNA